MAIEKAQGIVIRLSDYSETSQVATFLTDRAGKVAAIAKGSKRPGSSTGGALELLAVNEIVYSTGRSGGLATLREARTVERFGRLGGSLARYYAALYCAELSEIFGEGSEGSSGHFELAVDTLRALSQAPQEKVGNVVLYFESHLLSVSGLAPNLESCCRCGTRLAGAHALGISLEDGGALCESCGGGLPIGRGSVAALRRIFESTPHTVGRLRLGSGLATDVSGLLSAAIVYNAARVPRLLRYVKGDLKGAWRRWARPGTAAKHLDNENGRTYNRS